MSNGTLTKSVGMQKNKSLDSNLDEPSFHDVQNVDVFVLAAETGSRSSRLPVSVTNVRKCFFHRPHSTSCCAAVFYSGPSRSGLK